MKIMCISQIFEDNPVTPKYVILPLKSRLSGKIPRALNFSHSYFTMMPTSRVHKLGFPGPYIAYFSNCQEFEANYGRYVRGITAMSVFMLKTFLNECKANGEQLQLHTFR